MGKTGYVALRNNKDTRYKRKWDGVMYNVSALEVFTKKGKPILFDRKLNNGINLKVEVEEGQENMFEEVTIAEGEEELLHD